MEVRFINWHAIPKDDQEEVLLNIPIGGYVESLPYKVPDDLSSYKIPLHNHWIYKSEYGVMRMLEFEKVSTINLKKRERQIIFRRIR